MDTVYSISATGNENLFIAIINDAPRTHALTREIEQHASPISRNAFSRQ